MSMVEQPRCGRVQCGLLEGHRKAIETLQLFHRPPCCMPSARPVLPGTAWMPCRLTATLDALWRVFELLRLHGHLFGTSVLL
jgi:hypothetical protein